MNGLQQFSSLQLSMAECDMNQKKLTREQRKIMSVMKLFDKAEKFQLRKQARERDIQSQNPITPPQPKKKVKTNSITTSIDTSPASDGVSTTNLNQCSSNSFDVVGSQEKTEVRNRSVFNPAYGINEHQVFFHLMEYRNTQKQKTLAKMEVTPGDVCVEDGMGVDECSTQLLAKTVNVFSKVSNLFNIAKPSVLSMHHFKPKSIVKG